MKKICIIENCNQCRYFDESWGTRCFHPKVTKPHPEGVVPKKLKRTDYLIDFPEWCPLNNVNEI
jgi:hypothetical protein